MFMLSFELLLQNAGNFTVLIQFCHEQSQTLNIGVFVETVYPCTLGGRALAAVKTPSPAIRHHLP